MRIIGGHANDIYYIPMNLVNKFAKLAELFARHSVFVETTITTLLSCLEQDHVNIVVHNIWAKTRLTPWIHFDKFIKKDSFAFHPTKWSVLLDAKTENFTKYADFYCQAVLDFLHGIKI